VYFLGFRKPGFIVWAFLFLTLGFLLFASVMAAAGAIAPSAREGNQVTLLLMLPLMPTLMFGQLFMAGRFFRAGNLLSDASFSLRRLATEWRE
jgi:hypothetical protein